MREYCEVYFQLMVASKYVIQVEPVPRIIAVPLTCSTQPESAIRMLAEFAASGLYAKEIEGAHEAAVKLAERISNYIESQSEKVVLLPFQMLETMVPSSYRVVNCSPPNTSDLVDIIVRKQSSPISVFKSVYPMKWEKTGNDLVRLRDYLTV